MDAAMLASIRRFVSNLAMDFAALMRDLAASSHRAGDGESEERAQQDDLLDATLDDDGIDASGL
jgi:hypothetical protein